MSSIQTKSAANAAAIAALDAQNDIQDADLERLIKDISDLENMERELDIQVMIFELLLAALPNYDASQSQLDANALTLVAGATGFISEPYGGLYGDIEEDATNIGILQSDVLTLTGDISTTMGDVNLATSAAQTEEGRITDVMNNIGTAETEISNARDEYDTFKIIDDFYTTNDAVIDW